MAAQVPSGLKHVRGRSIMWTAARIAVGSVLLAAALLKLIQFIDGGADESILRGFAPRSTYSIIVLESALACWLFTGWHGVRLWEVTVLASVGMICVGACEVLAHRTSCGCFGVVSVDPRISLGVSTSMLLALIVSRPSTRETSGSRSSMLCRWMKPALLLTSVLLAVMVVIVVPDPRFLAKFRGDSIVSLPTVSRIEPRRPNEVVVLRLELCNVTDRPIRIIGMKTGCRCRLARPLPVTVLPNQAIPVAITFQAPRTLGKSSDEAVFFTDDTQQPYVVCRVIWDVG